MGPDTDPSGMFAEFDPRQMIARFSWENGMWQGSLMEIAQLNQRVANELSEALAQKELGVGDGQLRHLRVRLNSEGGVRTCEIGLASWAFAKQYFDRCLSTAVGKETTVERYLQTVS